MTIVDSVTDLRRKLERLRPNGGNTLANAVDGGYVHIESGTYNLGNAPLLIDHAQGVIGISGGTRIVYGGEGDAIRFSARALDTGLCNRPRVQGVMIYSAGGGIGIDTTKTKTLNAPVIDDVVFNCAGGAAINLPPLADCTYSATLSNISITGTPVDGRAMKVSGRLINLFNVEIVNVKGITVTNPDGSKTGVPVIELDGEGTVTGLWNEPYGGGTGAKFSGGGWDLRGCWFESHATGVAHILLDGVQVTAERLFFLEQAAWLECRNSYLDVQQSIHNGGDPMCVRKFNSSVRARGVDVAGMELAGGV